MFVNALSYGTIIPLLYPYASKFGIGPLGLGFLFASFSLAQFIFTPIIGRLSDRFGRKPLLLLSLFGTAVSLAMFASAQSAVMLFISRILDGVTGGNNSVAQAVIADAFPQNERAKGFGMLGAIFGFGFLIGPALGGILSPYGLTVPFWSAAVLAVLGTILGIILLPETLKKKNISGMNEPLFSPKKLITSLSIPVVGSLLLITFLANTSHSVFIVGFQAFSVDILKMSARDIGILYALVGLISIFVQAIGINFALKFMSKSMLLKTSLLLAAPTLIIASFQGSAWGFTPTIMLYPLFFGPQMILTSSILSEKTNAKDQGGILGINQGYMSLGQIIGPLVAGAISAWSIPAVFWTAAGFFVIAWISSFTRKTGDIDI